MPAKKEQSSEQTRSQKLFAKAPTPIKELVRAVLREEREVMHLKRRPDIHQKILEHIKRIT